MSPQDQHVTLRLSAELLERVEAYRKELELMTRQPVTRANALRSLVDAGLELVEQQKKK
ncbi:hypothetical protein GCM10007160_16850 [Litchfieldella qijiaojingensis]|uniref:Ribbon-helix-helix protein, CopG family n=1 Tax=Litchfieldella qijiaojingensis TaxID=980347 RepID=A0ABQ2YNA7_9GAMM|nr:hypothetical protein [Halomonas qijiaojingensis]GGX90032.1 hypothetical protein GCM10007160_16850 [Halomonas qijiaojingensis]